MLIDSHCHLDRLNLKHHNNDLSSAVGAAFDAGVEGMLCVCISKENKEAVVGIAEQYDKIVASVGVHPSDVKADVVSEAELKAWADHPKVVAIGETGLDYYYTSEFAEQQQQSFANHLGMW